MSINFTKIFSGVRVFPKATSTVDSAGDLDFSLDTDKLNLHNGTSASPVVTEAHTATLTNKTIDGDDNTLLNIPGSSIVGPIDATEIADGTVSNTEFQYINSVTSNVQDQIDAITSGTLPNTLTDSHIFVGNGSNVATDVAVSGDVTLSNTGVVAIAAGVIVNADINASAAIDATKLADGSVSNTELQYINSVTSNVQDQINALPTAASVTTFTNKTIDGDDNTVQDLALTSLKTNLTDASKFLERNASGVVISSVHTVPTGAVVGTTDAQVITAKDIDGGTASNTSRLTSPKNTKANLDGLTRKEATIVYGTDTKKLYVDDGTVLKGIGSGAGGGVNFLTLTTAWSPDNTDNSDFETSIGNWVTYDNGAVAVPTTMTGGSPSQLTLSRTTTVGEILDGTASLKLVKAAADAQGEGISCVANVPPAYSGKRAKISVPYRILSGSLVSGDVKCYVYDVTNSVLITPFNNDVVGSNGTLTAVFDVPNAASNANVQIRVGFHFATTSTVAVTLLMDDARVESLTNAVGGVVSSIQRLPLTASNTQGFGTPSADEVFWFQNGPTVHMFGRFASGVATGVEARINLPPGYVASNDFTNIKHVGSYLFNSNSATVINSSILSEPNVNYVTMGYQNSGTSPLTKQLGNTLFGSGNVISFYCEVPVQGVGTATLTQYSTFNLSQVLSTGTRVTSAPTKLGEYRTYQKGSNSNSVSDTAPTTAPSSSNGMAIGAFNYATAGSGTYNISMYDVFIGTNKNFSPQMYNAAGKTTPIDFDIYTNRSSFDGGTSFSYSPATGILTVRTGSWSNNSITSAWVGTTPTASGVSEVTTGFWDAIISESAAPLSVVTPNSCVIFNTGVTSNGSTNTTVRRFANVSTTGTALTAVQSTVNGDSVVVNENGNYSISFTDVATAVNGNYAAITINGTALTTDPSSLTFAQGYRMGSYNPSDEMWHVGSPTIPLIVGDVIRFQRTNARLSSSSRVVAIVTQVSKG